MTENLRDRAGCEEMTTCGMQLQGGTIWCRKEAGEEGRWREGSGGGDVKHTSKHIH